MESPSTLRPKRPRASKPKTRTGCSTCKLRRVKCDEARPICSRCQKTLRHCGYEDPEPPASRPLKAFMPIQPREGSKRKSGHMSQDGAAAPAFSGEKGVVLVRSQPSLLLINPSTTFSGDENEQRYFQLFREETVFDLCGYFEAPFWTSLVLQECHREPAIKHEVLALGALYKYSLNARAGNDEHRQFALVHQAKALKCLRQSLSVNTFPIRLALITSMVFGYLESLHGNWETAMEQINSGVNLLKTWQEAKNSKFSKAAKFIPNPAKIDPELLSILPRLDVQILSFLAMNPVSDKHFSTVEGIGDIGYIPERFGSVQELLPSATRMSILALIHLRKYQKIKSTTPIIFPSSLVRERDALMEAINSWDKTYQDARQKLQFKITDNVLLGGIMFDIYIMVFKIIAETGMCLEETVYDHFLERFEYVVRSSEYMLRKDQKMRAIDGTRLQFNIGLIMSLFYTATRCREGPVRRHAIALLQDYPSRNGVWDSWQASQIAEWVMRLEEEGCDEYGFVPEERRVRMHTLKWTRQGDRISVECMQGPMDGTLKTRKVNLLYQ